MAQFGGQKNPPWAAQFAATAVSQPGHSAQSLDLNSLHCELIFLHNLGAALSFVCICFYTVLLTHLTRKCMLTGLVHYVYPLRIVFSSIQVTLTILYCIFFTQKDFYYLHISAIFEWTLSVNLELFELSYAVEFYFFSSAMLSALLSNGDEESTIILS